jgi:hypothetical protein
MASGDDALGFSVYTEAIAEFLMAPGTKPPLTLSIEGDWGRGKSSFMLQLEQGLRAAAERRRVVAKGVDLQVVRFSAWRQDGSAGLWSSFALTFIKAIAPQGMIAAWYRGLKLAWTRFDGRTGWLDALKFLATLLVWIVVAVLAIRTVFFPRLLPDKLPEALDLPSTLRDKIEGWWLYLRWIFPLALSRPAITLARTIIKGPLQFQLKKYISSPAYRDNVPFVEDFHDDFAKLVDVYIGEGRKAFVLIDDLDRCEVPKAAELLQALNMMIPESSKLVFILGIDRKRVAAGIAAKYEKLLPFVAGRSSAAASTLPYDPALALEYGHDFLEKFIQLPFRLPRANAIDIAPMLDKLLNTTSAVAPARSRDLPPDPLDADGPEVRAAMEMVAPALDFNPRRLKHFLNLFRLRLYVAKTLQLRGRAQRPNLPTQRLAKLVAIELRWFPLLEDVLATPTLLSGLVGPAGAAGQQVGDPKAFQRWRGTAELIELLRFGVTEDALRFQLTREDVETLFGMGGGRRSSEGPTVGSLPSSKAPTALS